MTLWMKETNRNSHSESEEFLDETFFDGGDSKESDDSA